MDELHETLHEPRNIQKEHVRNEGKSSARHSSIPMHDLKPCSGDQLIDDLDGIDGGVCSTELESRLLRELIYAFQGIEGVMIKRKIKTSSIKGPTLPDIPNANATEEGNNQFNSKLQKALILT